MGVAEAAPSAPRNNHFLPVFKNFTDQFLCFGIQYNSSAGNNQNIVCAAASGAVAAFAVTAVLSNLVGVVVEVVQGVRIEIAAQDDAAAVSAVAAVGASVRCKLFAPERGNAVAAVAGFHEEFDAIFEYDGFHGGYLK